MEYLLEHLEAMKERYEYHPDIHFRTNINLGWSKIDEHYNRTKSLPLMLRLSSSILSTSGSGLRLNRKNARVG